jgi:hypothetical protein
MKSFIRRFWQRHEYLSIGLMWAAIVLILFWEPLTSGPDRVIGGNDITYAYLPWQRYFVESVRNGSFPLWNPYVFAGTPFSANPQTALFYPPTWLALWVGPERAFGLSTALHTWIAALGMFGWMRQVGAARAGALFASIAYALSGFMSARIWAGHYGPMLEASLLPLLLWLATRAVQRRSIGWAIVAGVPFGLMILAGHTPTFVLLALGAGIVVIFEAIRLTLGAEPALSLPKGLPTAPQAASVKRPFVALRAGLRPSRQGNSAVKNIVASLGLFALTALFGLALAAVQILPALTFVENSARLAGLSAEFTSRFSMPPAHLLQLVVPDFFGEPAHSGYWGAPVFEEYIYYVGVPTLILAFLSLFAREARARFLVAFGVFGLIVALGPAGGVYSVLYRFVPFFDLLRAPARAGMWSVLSFSAAAGLCLSALRAPDGEWRRRVLGKWSGRLAGAIAALGLAAAGVAQAQFGATPAPERHLAGDIAAFVLLFVAASALIRLWLSRPKRSALWLALLTALLMIDLSSYHISLVRMAPSTRGEPYAAADRALGDRLKDNRLIWVYADLFELNLGMDFGQSNVYGYDSLITARLQALVDRAHDLSTPIYDLLNVRYVISQSPLSEPVDPIAEAGGFIFYERPRAAPRAWIVHAIESVPDDDAALDRVADPDFDPRATAIILGDVPCEVTPQVEAGSVSITRYEPNRIEAKVDAGAAGLLVLSEIDYPGWVASIDGAPAEIHRVDYALRGVCLPGGSHTLTMVFDPPELKAGAVVSLVALGFIGAAGVVIVRRRRDADRHG